MTDTASETRVRLDQIQTLLGEHGYDVHPVLDDAENGISTSSFQYYDRRDGTVSLALNNF